MATVQELLRSGDDLPVDSARRDTEILLGFCLARSRSWLYTWPEREVDDAEATRFKTLLSQRREGRPVAYLIGQREFWSLPLKLNQHTLIPRPETETLVSWALELTLPEQAQVLDLGTGSGAIALALASERPTWQVQGLDLSADAVAVATGNAEHLDLQRVKFFQSDWYAAVSGRRFHLLVANPPYIDPDDDHLRRGDLRFEPRSALVAADNGLADLSVLVANARDCLLPEGWLILEHGFSQGQAVRNLFHEAGFSEVSTRADLAGQERVTGGRQRAK